MKTISEETHSMQCPVQKTLTTRILLDGEHYIVEYYVNMKYLQKWFRRGKHITLENAQHSVRYLVRERNNIKPEGMAVPFEWEKECD